MARLPRGQGLDEIAAFHQVSREADRSCRDRRLSALNPLSGTRTGSSQADTLDTGCVAFGYGRRQSVAFHLTPIPKYAELQGSIQSGGAFCDGRRQPAGGPRYDAGLQANR